MPLATTSNYPSIAHSYALQITNRFLVTAFNNEEFSASFLTSLLSDEYPATDLSQPAWDPRYIVLGGPNKRHRFQQFPCFCHGQLPSDSSDIADVFTGRYQATHVPPSDCCTATALQATMSMNSCFCVGEKTYIFSGHMDT